MRTRSCPLAYCHQKPRDNIPNPQQDNMDTKQSLQVRPSTRSYLPQMWHSGNYGAPPLHLGKFCRESPLISYVAQLRRLLYIPAFALTLMEIGHNKPHPSILLHLQDTKTRKVIILLIQEIKRDIIYLHTQLKYPRRQENLLSTIIKLQPFWNIIVSSCSRTHLSSSADLNNV